MYTAPSPDELKEDIEFINLTGIDITILDDRLQTIMELPAGPRKAWISNYFEQATAQLETDWGGIPLHNITTDLTVSHIDKQERDPFPPSYPGVVYITSVSVAAMLTATGRRDVYSPGRTIKRNNRIIGCLCLARHPQE